MIKGTLRLAGRVPLAGRRTHAAYFGTTRLLPHFFDMEKWGVRLLDSWGGWKGVMPCFNEQILGLQKRPQEHKQHKLQLYEPTAGWK